MNATKNPNRGYERLAIIAIGASILTLTILFFSSVMLIRQVNDLHEATQKRMDKFRVGFFVVEK
jgi:hypothetical protein